MKPLPEPGAALRRAAAQRTAWALELTDGGWGWRGATQPLALEGIEFPARLGGVERWREWLPEGALAGGRARAEALVRIPDAFGDAGGVRAALETRPPLRIAATLRLAWLDPQGGPPAAATMLRGRVAAWRLEAAATVLSLIDDLQGLAPRRIGRLLRASMRPGSRSPLLGRPLPWVFGTLDDVTLDPLDAGPATALREPIDAAATVIPVVALEGFAPAGAVQVDGELIRYDSLTLEPPALGTAELGVVRAPDAAAHSRGAPVRRVPPGGFWWFVADHPCRAVGPVRADGWVLDPAEWSAQVFELGGVAAQGVRMARWPLNARGEPAVRVHARVEGLADADGVLIDNPARVVEALLVHPRLGALATERLDAARWAALADAHEARGRRFARRVEGDVGLGELLDQAAAEACLWMGAADPLAPVEAPPVPRPGDAVEHWTTAELLPPAEAAQLQAAEAPLPPDAVELVAASAEPGASRAAWLFPPERLDAGTMPTRLTIHWVDPQSAAPTDLGELRWRRLAEAPFRRVLAAPLGAATLSAGDTLVVSDPVLDMDETPGWVRAIEVRGDSPARAWVELWGPWAGAFCARLDALHYLRRFAFGAHLALVVGGRTAGLLTREGTLRLAGRLRERDVWSGSSPEGAVTLDGGRLVLAAPVSGGWTPFFWIDAAGDAGLVGAVRERSVPAIDPMGQSLGTAEGMLWLAPDGRSAALAWDAAAGVLHVNGVVIERAYL